MTIADDDAGTVVFEQNGGEGERLDAAPTPEELAAWKLTYFGNRLCPFAHRAWWALHEKGVADRFKYIHIDLGQDKPAWFKAQVNPFGTVPCIYDGDRGVFESAVCMEYIDEKFPTDGLKLFPGDAVTRASIRAFISTLDFKPIYGYIMEQDRTKDASHAAACDALMAAIETKYSAASPAGPFFLGAELSAADIAVFPFLDRMVPGLRTYRGYDLWGSGGGTAYPRLKAAWDAIQTRPAWRATQQSEEYYVAAYQGYATGKPGTVPKRVKAASPDASKFPATASM